MFLSVFRTCAGARNPSTHYVTDLFYWIPLAFDRLAVRFVENRPAMDGLISLLLRVSTTVTFRSLELISR